MKHIAALYRAIKLFDTQQALANAIGVSRKKLNNWLNYNVRIPYHHAIAIEIVTEGAVKAEELAPHIQFKKNGKKLRLYFSAEIIEDVDQNEKKLKVSKN